MQGIDSIVEKITEDALSYRDKVIDDAKKRAESILSDADSKLETEIAKINEQTEKQIEEKNRRSDALLSLEIKKIALSVKRDMIEQAFKNAEDMIKALPAAEYEQMLIKLITSKLVSGNEQIILSQSDSKKVSVQFLDKLNKSAAQKGLRSELTLADYNADLQGGFIIKMGDIEINGSIHNIVKYLKQEIEPHVVKILFG